MRKLFTLSTLVLVGCGTLPSDAGPADDLRPSFSAAENMSNTVVPFNIGVFVPCAMNGAGEVVLLSGNLHVLTFFTTSSNGNTTIRTHFQPQQLTGLGLTSGASYQGTGVTQSTQTFTSPAPWTFTFINNFRMIGQGPGNNFMVHQTTHTTVNANGDVTATVNNTSITCK